MPMLSKEEEKQLAEDLFQKGDLESAQKLVLAHLRVVVSVSRHIKLRSSQADIIQEGNVGLMKAVRRFDPLMGKAFFICNSLDQGGDSRIYSTKLEDCKSCHDKSTENF